MKTEDMKTSLDAPSKHAGLQKARVGEIAALLFIIFGMCCEGSFVIDIS